MAARVTKIRHDEETRAKIQASQLINRLQEHALGDKEIMTPSQIKAVEILLKKTLPDLSAITVDGGLDHDVTITEVRRTIVDPRPQST